MYVLAPYCEVRKVGDAFHVGFGSARTIVDDPAEVDGLFRILAQFRTPADLEGFRADLVGERSVELVDRLVRNRVLVPSKDVPEYNRHHREQLYFLLAGAAPNDVSGRLARSSVTIVGCGGIGSLMALKLATVGVGEVVLMDDDLVEPHNLSRQFLFREGDVGFAKVGILKRELELRNSNVSIVGVPERARFEHDVNIPRSDVLILAADEPGIIPKANAYCIDADQAFMHICYINDIAAWGPLVVPGSSGCWSCQAHIGSTQSQRSSEDQEVLDDINGSYTCPVISSVSSIAVSLACLDVLRHLGRFGEPKSLNHRIGLWTHELRFEYQDFSRNPGCVDCGRMPS